MKIFKGLKRQAKGASISGRKCTAGLATVTMPAPKKLVLLMSQHIGAPSKPVVKRGERVEVGTLVAEAGGTVGAHIHSGVSGVVTSIEDVLDATGTMTQAIIIEADGQQTIASTVIPPVVRDKETFLEAVRASGLVGLGGAGFPTDVKLNPPEDKKVDTLLINAAECEPYLTSDDREMLECGDSILTGINAVRKYLNIEKAVIAVERNKPDAMDLMFSLTKGDAGLSVAPLPTNYPQGAEKVLIETVTGREVPRGGIPADIGVIVMNVTTVSTIGKYLATGMPLVQRRLTVDGAAVVEPKNVNVVVGTPIEEVVEFCGGVKVAPEKVITGGPLMGVAVSDMGYPVTKQNNAILLFTKEEAAMQEENPCIHCGKCVAACPIGLSPVEIKEAYEARDVEMLGKLSADICMNCGVCSYVCPAKILVAQYCSLGRAYYEKEVKNNGK